MGLPFTYTVLRYIHDVVTGEFINVGIVVYAPAIPQAKALCIKNTSRAKAVFPAMNEAFLLDTLAFVAARINQWDFGKDIPADARALAACVLPHDSSSLQWSEMGGGLAEDLERSAERLFQRLVVPQANA